METVNQETNITAENESTEEKTFTQADLDRVVAERLARERQKYEGFSELQEKAAKFDELEAASKTELQKATEKAEKLEAELNSIKKANEIRTIREKVAKETGIPVNLLTAETEASCTEQAKSILEFAKPGRYPALPDNGEVHRATVKQSTKQQFAEWADKAFN